MSNNTGAMSVMKFSSQSVAKAGGELRITDSDEIQILMPVVDFFPGAVHNVLTDQGLSDNDAEYAVGALYDAVRTITTARFMTKAQVK